MIKELILHNLKSIARSKEFGKKSVSGIVMGIFLVLMGINILSIGLFLGMLIREKMQPGENPVSIFNGALIFYFGMDLILRLVFQKYHSLEVKPYLVLNVKRERIARLLISKTLFTVMNLYPLLLLIPFAAGEVFGIYRFSSSIAWLFSLISMMLFNCYLSNYLRARFLKNPVIVTIAGGILAALAFLQYFRIYSSSALSESVFDGILAQPVFVFAPLAALLIIYNMNYTYYLGNLYLDSASGKSKIKLRVPGFSFLKDLGLDGSLILLELKLLIRNKRARATLITPFLFVFYGLFFYPNGEVSSGIIFVFLGTFITGLFVLSYSNLTFSFASGHFGFLMTGNLKLNSYLRAKFHLIILVSLLIYLISLFYIIYGVKIVLINGAMLLFNIGVTFFVMLVIAGFTKNKFDMSLGVYSQQGRNSQQFFSAFVIIALQAAVFLPVKYLLNDESGYIALALLGMSGIIFSEKLIDLYVNFFRKRKYIMVQGFREN